jgi:hypothetical protein
LIFVDEPNQSKGAPVQPSTRADLFPVLFLLSFSGPLRQKAQNAPPRGRSRNEKLTDTDKKNTSQQFLSARRAAAALRSSVAVASSPLLPSQSAAAPRGNNRAALATRASVTTTEPVAAAAKAGEW